MRSIKPGRGPSGMGVLGGIIMSLFGLGWTISAASMGAFFMVPFGILFIVMAIAITVYNYKNATGKNRYSTFDIVEDGEEEDPLNARFGEKRESEENKEGGKKFCPYCGEKTDETHKFCSNCGSKLE
ncbi:MAG: zinc-ribbon domain-containing protein [Clostridia bacterium]|nr:zinc-ribbon domain-containing protein [Clostridia bacterium]